MWIGWVTSPSGLLGRLRPELPGPLLHRLGRLEGAHLLEHVRYARVGVPGPTDYEHLMAQLPHVGRSEGRQGIPVVDSELDSHPSLDAAEGRDALVDEDTGGVVRRGDHRDQPWIRLRDLQEVGVYTFAEVGLVGLHRSHLRIAVRHLEQSHAVYVRFAASRLSAPGVRAGDVVFKPLIFDHVARQPFGDLERTGAHSLFPGYGIALRILGCQLRRQHPDRRPTGVPREYGEGFGHRQSERLVVYKRRSRLGKVPHVLGHWNDLVMPLVQRRGGCRPPRPLSRHGRSDHL